MTSKTVGYIVLTVVVMASMWFLLPPALNWLLDFWTEILNSALAVFGYEATRAQARDIYIVAFIIGEFFKSHTTVKK